MKLYDEWMSSDLAIEYETAGVKHIYERPLFVTNNVFDMLQGKTTTIPITTLIDSLSLAPPFSSFAIEAYSKITKTTSLLIIDTLRRTIADKENHSQFFIDIASRIGHDITEFNWLYFIKTFIKYKESNARIFVDNALIAVDKQGNSMMQSTALFLHSKNGYMIKRFASKINGQSEDFLNLNNEDKERIMMLVNPSILSSLYAISLMNCRNVERVENHPKRYEQKQAKRTGIPVHDYWTLHIKKTRKQYENEGNGGSSALKRHHIRRGHFKTYTDDAPLFGRYTGTYFWEASAVGSKERGTVRKDYHIDTSEE